MKIKFNNEDYEFLDDLLEDFLENPPRKYKKLENCMKKFDEKIELEYIELLKQFEKYKNSLKNMKKYEIAISYQLGLMRGLEICGIDENKIKKMEELKKV